jgi:viroplasmin and RNaseH domain-containing protein
MVQDDHGHSYHIKDFPSKEEAEKYLEELDRRNTTHVGQGHKQHYTGSSGSPAHRAQQLSDDVEAST